MTKTVLAIDYGTVVTGLALFRGGGDPWPWPYGKIVYKDDPRLVEAVLGKIAEESVEVVVLGIPLCKDGGGSPMTKKVEKFGNMLEKNLPEGIEFYGHNEYLSTFEAEERMKSSPRYNFKVDPKQVDALAACIILEEFLMEK